MSKKNVKCYRHSQSPSNTHTQTLSFNQSIIFGAELSKQINYYFYYYYDDDDDDDDDFLTMVLT